MFDGHTPGKRAKRAAGRVHATIYDVAELARVSTATVSRVVNDADGIRPATRDRVTSAIAELGYVPNGSAQGLGRQTTGVIGLVYRRRADARRAGEANTARESVIEQGRQSLIFYDQLIRSVEDAVYDVGHALLLTGARSDHELDAVMRIARKCDGVVLMERVVADEDLHHVTRQVPVACIAHDVDIPSVSTVMVDNADSMVALLDHMVTDHRVSSVAMLGGPIDSSDATTRAQALRDDAVRRGLDLLPLDEWRGDFTVGAAYDLVMRNCAPGRTSPDVIMCVNDGSASGAIAVLRTLGRQVPHDIAVTGFDDMEIARLTSPSLTTVHQPLDEMARVAVSALLQPLHPDAATPAKRLVPGHLVIRESCGCRVSHGGSTSAAHGQPPPELNELELEPTS